MRQLLKFSLLLWIPALLLVAATPPATPEDSGGDKPTWYAYSSAAGKFKMKFPGRTEVSQEEKDMATTYKVTAEYKGATYFVGFTLHKQDMPDPIGLADVSLEAFSNTLNGKIVSNSPWKVKKHVGKDATIRLAEKDALVRYKVLIRDRIQYQLVVVSQISDFDDKIARKFFKSFKLTK